jgi:aspartyl/glutamyl-tRNA(Asn/Gln) amidotransferase C subunit
MISQEDLENLSSLARLDLKKEEREKLTADLAKILDHFKELKEIDTAAVLPMTGGTFAVNVFRTDENQTTSLPAARAVEQFPEKEKGFLKIPPVF